MSSAHQFDTVLVFATPSDTQQKASGIAQQEAYVGYIKSN